MLLVVGLPRVTRFILDVRPGTYIEYVDSVSVNTYVRRQYNINGGLVANAGTLNTVRTSPTNFLSSLRGKLVLAIRLKFTVLHFFLMNPLRHKFKYIAKSRTICTNSYDRFLLFYLKQSNKQKSKKESNNKGQ